MKTVTMDANYYGPDPELSIITVDESILRKLMPNLAFTAARLNKEQLPSDFYTQKEVKASAVKLYERMLNRNFPPKTVFIYDLDLVDRIIECYGQAKEHEVSSRDKQELLREIHHYTGGVLLSSFHYQLFTLQSDQGTFDFVEVDHGDRELKGKQADVAFFKTFFQDYLHLTKSQRKSSGGSHSAAGTGTMTNPNISFTGFEDNLALWKVERVSDLQPASQPLNAIMRIREICHLSRPSSSALNDSQESQNVDNTMQLLNESQNSSAQSKCVIDGVAVVRRRGGRLGRKRAKRDPHAPVENGLVGKKLFNENEAKELDMAIYYVVNSELLELIFKLEIILDKMLI